MSIRDNNHSYRRGAIFGFTVAEVILLLVFCLLLLFIPLVLKNQQELAAASDGSLVGSSKGNGSAGYLADPSKSDQSGSSAEPLPEGWVRVSPDAASSATKPSNASNDRIGTQSPSQTKREAPQQNEAERATEALTLQAACERLGISFSKCTVTSVNEKIAGLGRHNWPPMIKLKEADGEFFLSGQADVSAAFEKKIRDTVPIILSYAQQYQTDVVEVVGHTDEQPIQGLASNLDSSVLGVLNKNDPLGGMHVADNAGLGFARAVAIVQILRSDKRLSALTILPLSAAQVVNKDGKISDGSDTGDVKERRRIEIRLRKSDP